MILLTLVFILEFRLWKTFFSRPEYDPKKDNIFIRSMTVFPFLLTAVTIFLLQPDVRNLDFLPIIWLTGMEDVYFRGLFFLIFPKTIPYCFVSALLFGTYGFLLVPKPPSFFSYFFLGMIYAVGSRRFSLAGLCLNRIVLNISILA